MKRDLDGIDLRGAFAPEPESCHDALMRAARSVKEEKQVKRKMMSTALIAAAILVATMAVAAAASGLFGWSDFFGDHYNTFVPEAGQEIMNAGDAMTVTLGDVTFTTKELLCDGHIALASTEVTLAEGGDALLCMEPFDAVGAEGEHGREAAQRLGVEPQTTWIEAAAKLGRKLYSVRATLEVPGEYMDGDQMEGAMTNADGSVSYFSMPAVGNMTPGETVDVQMFLRVAQWDPLTGEEIDKQTTRETVQLFAAPPIAEAQYRFDGEFAPDGYRLEGVRAELTPAGMYITATVTAPEGATIDDLWERSNEFPQWFDAKGERFATGISLTGIVDERAFPTVVFTEMVSVEELPEAMTLRMEDSESGTGYSELTVTK